MLKITYTIHETGTIEIEEDEEFLDVFSNYDNNLVAYTKAEVAQQTNYRDLNSISVHTVYE
jgi:hypothetical protein